MKRDIKEFFKLYFKCFLILLFMGVVMPKAVEFILNYFVSCNIYENSQFVYKSINKQLEIIYNYLQIFDLFLY